MSSHLLRAVSLGLALAASSLASANAPVPTPRAAPSAIALAAQRAAFRAHAELHDALHPQHGQSADLTLIGMHQREVVAVRTGTNTATILETPAGALVFDGLQLSVQRGGKTDTANVEGVAALGITSDHALQTALQRHMLVLAGMAGKEPTAETMKAAHAVLHKELADAGKMNDLLRDLAGHSDIDITMRHLIAMSKDKTKPAKRFILAQNEKETIEVELRGNRPGMTIAPQYALWKTTLGQPLNTVGQASLADLMRHQIGTRAELDAAVGHAMLGLYALEDLPLHPH